MTDGLRDIAASVRQQLMNRRQATGEEYNVLLIQYAVERFLYRLSRSDLADRFVLKGAMLFRVWGGGLHRPTRDLDLLGYGDPSPDAVAGAIRHVLAAPVADDGLRFDADALAAEGIRDGQEYGGVRVKLVAMLGTARIPMQIDVGFGDAVTPKAGVGAYPTLLDMEAPHLLMYPPQTVVAEKLHAAVALGMTNSRMKDYYDLLVICRAHTLSDTTLAQAIAATFRHRGTPLPQDVPPGLSDEFGTDQVAQRLWRGLLQRLRIQDAPSDFATVVKTVRDRLWPAMVLARGRS